MHSQEGQGSPKKLRAEWGPREQNGLPLPVSFLSPSPCRFQVAATLSVSEISAGRNGWQGPPALLRGWTFTLAFSNATRGRRLIVTTHGHMAHFDHSDPGEVLHSK